MFSLKESFEIDRQRLKCDFIRYVIASLVTLKEIKSLNLYGLIKEDSNFFLKISYKILDFDFSIQSIFRFGYAQDMFLVKLGPIVLFCEYTSKTTCGKQIDLITNAHFFAERKKF